MDKEDFQAWKDSPATQWVMGYMRSVADRVEAGVKDRLFGNVQLVSDSWANLQVLVSDEAGYVRALREIIELEHDDIVKNRDNSTDSRS